LFGFPFPRSGHTTFFCRTCGETRGTVCFEARGNATGVSGRSSCPIQAMRFGRRWRTKEHQAFMNTVCLRLAVLLFTILDSTERRCGDLGNSTRNRTEFGCPDDYHPAFARPGRQQTSAAWTTHRSSASSSQSCTPTFRITTCTMKFSSPIIGLTMVAMSSLVKADWFANFFDGQWIGSPSAPPSPDLADWFSR
jgi:hypothetical protein